jgi:hypothetical protein
LSVNFTITSNKLLFVSDRLSGPNFSEIIIALLCNYYSF